MIRVLKQPLLHFLFIGTVIFIFYNVNNEERIAPNDKEIVVNREILLNFMQYRASAFSPEAFSERLNSMSEEEITALVKDYVREEVLYQEALAMEMNQGDYIIRQRLVQKVEFLLESLISDNLSPSEEELNEYYLAHLNDYKVEAVYSFTHIFYDESKHGWEDALSLVNKQLNESSHITFNDASQYGDRYPFLQNYVERTHDYVANNFSNEFVDELDKLMLTSDLWQGPLVSRYGYHLVMLTKRSEPFIPELKQVLGRVQGDYQYETVLKNTRAAEDEVIADYSVSVDLQ